MDATRRQRQQLEQSRAGREERVVTSEREVMSGEEVGE